MREQPICRSAATPDADLAVQHNGRFWAGCVSLWALGYGLSPYDLRGDLRGAVVVLLRQGALICRRR